MRQCLFCDQKADSKEHVWPDWILEQLKSKRKFAIMGQLDGRPIMLAGFKPELRAKFVCQTCNEGWMGSIEKTNRHVLGPMLHDISISLDVEEQRSASLWTLKTAMVLGGVASRKTPFYNQKEREALRTASAIPANTFIWLARYVGPNSPGFFGMHGWNERPDNPKVLHCYITTFVFGHVAIQVFSVHTPDGHPTVNINAVPGPWNESLIRVWPANDRRIFWPPHITFDDRNLGLGDLANRFKAEGSISLS